MRTYLLVLLANFPLIVNCQSDVCKSPNTGSVLFRNIDMYRRDCWSQEELGMVYARRAMVALIPKQIPHNIPIILEYIQICISTLKEVAMTPEVHEYMLAALADTFGGYLQTFGLPLLHESYYEGYISYETAREFHRMFDDFKTILMTTGEGWSKPMEVRKHINRVLPLKLPMALGSKPCSLIMLNDSSSQKVSVSEVSNTDHKTNSVIPLPIIDDCKHLSSIAIPFKTRALYNLKSRHSYDIMIKYYIEATRCLAVSQYSNEGQLQFDQIFSDWLKTTVTAHLKDEDWYVGFSNILRIQETIQQKGGIIVTGLPQDVEEDSLFTELENETQLTRTAYIIIIIILILSIIFLCFLYWALIKKCLMFCGYMDMESSKGQPGDQSDQSALLSHIDDDDYSSRESSAFEEQCKHNNNKVQKRKSEAQSRKTVSEESRLTLSCGLGRGFPSRCRKHRH